jgi:hypothetical protein
MFTAFRVVEPMEKPVFAFGSLGTRGEAGS